MAVKIRQYKELTVSPDIMKDLMDIETRCFNPNIQETYESKKELVESADIVLFAYDGERIIGEAYTAQEEAGDMGDPGNKDTIHLAEVFKDMKCAGGVYFMSLAVLPEYQGKGIARQLLIDMTYCCVRKGFSYIYTHAKEGSSAHLFHSLGGKMLSKRENWFDTGNTHYLFKISLWR